MNCIYDMIINKLSAKAAADKARAAATHKNVALDILGMIDAQASTGNYELTLSYKSMETVDKALLDEVLAEFTRCKYIITTGSEGYKIAWPMPPEVVPSDPPVSLLDSEDLLKESLRIFTKGAEVYCVIKQLFETRTHGIVDVRKYKGDEIRKGIETAKLAIKNLDVIYNPVRCQVHVSQVSKD